MKFLNFFRKEDKQPSITIQVKKLDENAVIPSYAHNGDVGMDMTAIAVEYNEEHDMYIYHTGLAFASDFNIGQFLFLRSSNCKTDAYLCNGVGIGDSPIYRGPIQFRMKNRTPFKLIKELESQKIYFDVYTKEMLAWDGKSKSYNHFQQRALNAAASAKQALIDDLDKRVRNLEFAPYKVGDRVGQMVFLKYPTVKLEVVDELNDTVRGDGGFGSTGN